MIMISEQAQQHFAKLLSKQPTGTHIRVFVVNPGTAQAECGVSYCPPDAASEMPKSTSMVTAPGMLEYRALVGVSGVMIFRLGSSWKERMCYRLRPHSIVA